ncbi:MAG: hypothetical protein WD003_00510 [Candidatus Paceibacterota bacterium]
MGFKKVVSSDLIGGYEAGHKSFRNGYTVSQCAIGALRETSAYKYILYAILAQA